MKTEVYGQPGIEGDSIVIRVCVDRCHIVSVFIGDWAVTRTEHPDATASAAATETAREWLRQHREEAHLWYGELELARKRKSK